MPSAIPALDRLRGRAVGTNLIRDGVHLGRRIPE